MTVIQRVIKPRNRRSKRALENREPKNIENTKQCLFLYGHKTSEEIRKCLKDIYALKKYDSQHMQRKNLVRPFEDHLPLERLSQKHDASLFCLASHSKKRPNNLVIGRMFDHHLLDMMELGVSRYLGLSDFPNSKVSTGTKPCLVFCGTQFEDQAEFRTLKNLLLDLFRGVEATEVRLQGFELALHFTAVEGQVLFRTYRILLKKSGVRVPRVELEEIGPSMTLTVRRSRLASDDLMKRSRRQPKQTKLNRVKNISKDAFGSRLGRIHMTSQDLSGLQTRKMKGLKTAAKKKGTRKGGEEEDAGEAMDVAE